MKDKKSIICLSISVVIVVLGIAVAIKINNKETLFKSTLENKEKNALISSENEDNIILNVTMEASYKTGNIEELYEDSPVVLIAEFLRDEKTEIKYNDIPNTYSSFKIKQIIKNESGVKLGDEILVKRAGGVVTFQQLLDARGPEYAKKIGADNISKEKTKTGLVKFSHNNNLGDKSLNECKTRLLMLNYDKTDDTFVVMQDDYGMLSYDEKANTAFGIGDKKNIEYSFLQK